MPFQLKKVFIGMHNFRRVWETCKGLLKRIILTIVNTVRTTLFRTITIGVKTIATIGTEIRLNSKLSRVGDL